MCVIVVLLKLVAIRRDMLYVLGKNNSPKMSTSQFLEP